MQDDIQNTDPIDISLNQLDLNEVGTCWLICYFFLYSCRGSLSGVETRGNSYKLVPDRSKYELRRHYFSHRIVSVWNSLPDSVVAYLLSLLTV